MYRTRSRTIDHFGEARDDLKTSRRRRSCRSWDASLPYESPESGLSSALILSSRIWPQEMACGTESNGIAHIIEAFFLDLHTILPS